MDVDQEKTAPVAEETDVVYKKNLGDNIRHIRQMLRMKQETLAELAGYSQSMISSFENRESIDRETLTRIADALKVPVELIENFDLEGIVYNIQTEQANVGHYPSSSTSTSTITNTLDVIKFALESNQKLYERIISELKSEIKQLKNGAKQTNKK